MSDRATVFVMAPPGFEWAASFRARLSSALGRAGSPSRVSLLAPHSAAAIKKEASRIASAFRKSTGMDYPTELPRPDTIASVWKRFNAMLGCERATRIAIVVLVTGEERDNPYLLWPVRCLIHQGRPDALVPVIVGGGMPRPRDRSQSRRLLAATACEDWRRRRGGEQYDALAQRLAAVLERPFSPLPARRQTALRELVRVDGAGGGDCYRINEGLALAAPGGRVEVAPGTYLESLRPYRRVMLIAPEGGVTVIGSGSALDVRPRSDEKRGAGGGYGAPRGRIELSNLTLRAAGAPEWSDAVRLSAGDVLLRNCVVESSGRGVALADWGSVPPPRARLEDCAVAAAATGVEAAAGRLVLRGCVVRGTGDPDPNQVGLWLSGAASAAVTKCSFHGLHWPITVQDSARLTTTDSVVRGGNHGVIAKGEATLHLHRTRVEGSAWGVVASEAATLTASACRFLGCGYDGVFAQGSVQAAVWDSIFKGNHTCGARVKDTATLVIATSRLLGNGFGAAALGEGALDVVACEVRSNASYGVGAADDATFRVAASSLLRNSIGIQVTDQAQGEIADNSLDGNVRYGVGLWTSGRVALSNNTHSKQPPDKFFASDRTTVIRPDAG